MKTFYLSYLVLFFFSCNSNEDSGADNCIEFKPAGVEYVVEKANADASSHLFDVAFRVISGCGQFNSFEQTKQGNVITINVIAKYEGCFCTEDTPLRETVYVFNENAPGTYTLKFKMSDDNYVTQMVTIE